MAPGWGLEEKKGLESSSWVELLGIGPCKNFFFKTTSLAGSS